MFSTTTSRLSLLCLLFLMICTSVHAQFKEQQWSSFRHKDVDGFKLSRHGRHYGYSFWIKRRSKRVKAKYFASGDAYRNFRNWKSGKDIVLVCSGAYSNSHVPVGVTVDNGSIVNRSVENSMDGLVIVYATGGVVVSDIDNCDLWLKSLKRDICLRSRSDKYELLRWAESESATLFQTHLLAYKNTLRISSNAPRESAERRILVLGKNKYGEVVHIVFDITKEVYLYNISRDILNYLKDEKIEVIAMLNLDTGMYNIMEARSNRRVVREEGDISEATNLLVYYTEE